MQGKCLKFHRDRGFGFLLSSNDPCAPDIFCHFSDILPSDYWKRRFLLPEMVLEFDVEVAPTAEFPDRLKAKNVRVIAPVMIAVQRSVASKVGGRS